MMDYNTPCIVQATSESMGPDLRQQDLGSIPQCLLLPSTSVAVHRCFGLRRHACIFFHSSIPSSFHRVSMALSCHVFMAFCTFLCRGMPSFSNGSACITATRRYYAPKKDFLRKRIDSRKPKTNSPIKLASTGCFRFEP